MPKIIPDNVDRAFLLGQRIGGVPLEFHFWIGAGSFPLTVVDPPWRASAHGQWTKLTFDHCLMDARSAFALVSGRASNVNWTGRDRSVLEVNGAKTAKVPRRKIQRLFRPIAWIPVDRSRNLTAKGPLLVRVPEGSLLRAPGRSITAEVVARVHRLALSARQYGPTYSAVLVPLDARRSSEETRLGNYSSSELSIATNLAGVDEEVSRFFSSVRQGKLWALWRLSRYGGQPAFVKWLTIGVARVFRLPRETAIVSQLRIPGATSNELSRDLYFEVPRRSSRTLTIGIVESNSSVTLCIGSDRDSLIALRNTFQELFSEIELPGL